MSEMALTADHLIVIGRGRLIADASTDEVIRLSSSTHIRVRSPQADAIADLVTGRGGTVGRDPDGALSVTGMAAPAIGELAAANGVVLHELALVQASLEQAFMELTEDSVEFRAPGYGQPPATPSGWGRQ
jgi:ABC-2 type transport system ATP-binding protein